MKDILKTTICISMLIFTSCSKDETSINTSGSDIDMPRIHDAIEIDIDEDGITDYKIQFDQPFFSSPFEGTQTGIVGRFLSYGENEILQNIEASNLFLRNIAEIEDNVTEPLFWNDQAGIAEIVSITTNTKGEWPAKWEINSDNVHPSYFIGLKMVTDNGFELAWIELEINSSDGFISIIDKGIL